MPLEGVGQVPSIAWRSELLDSAPGHVVVDAIATQLDVPFESVRAAVLLARHPAGNSLAGWIFQVDGAGAAEAANRWIAGTNEQRCAGPVEAGTLVGKQVALVHQRYIDRCQPQYVVVLDETTVGVITDTAGTYGEGPDLKYRPLVDVASFVLWMESERRSIHLETGGPPIVQG